MNKPKRKLKFSRLLIVLVVMLYTSMFIYTFFNQFVKTYIIDEGSIEEFDNAKGYIFRDEQVVYSGNSGKIKPIINEGERVAKGDVIATVETDASKDIEKKISEIDKQIESLIKDQQGTKLGQLIFSQDVQRINQIVEQKVLTLSQLINSNDIAKINSLKSEINENLSKKARVTGINGANSQQIENLNSQKEVYLGQLENSDTSISADIAGMVSYSVDGSEQLFNNQNIDNLTVGQLMELDQQLSKQSHDVSEKAIKITNNFKCSIGVILKNNKNFDKAQVGETVYLRFAESDGDSIPAVIRHVSEEENAKIAVIFDISQKVENLLTIREMNVDVIWKKYSGLKIPISALKEKDGKKGVLVVKANYTQFREVEELTRDKEYVIIQNNGIRASTASLYDEIILKAINVEEDRQIRKW